MSTPRHDGECSQLLCWPLVPYPNSCAHFISATGSAGLGAMGTHSCVLQDKFLCVKYHERWCRVGRCVSYFSCCRNVSLWQSSLRKERFTRGFTSLKLQSITAGKAQSLRQLVLWRPPSGSRDTCWFLAQLLLLFSAGPQTMGWCNPELGSSTSVNLT